MMILENVECIHFDYLNSEEPYCKLKMEYYPDCFLCDCPEIIGLNKKGVNKMAQQTFETTDYGEMTLAKLETDGVEFLLQSVEKLPSKFGKGDFVVLLGTRNGEAYEIRAGGRAATLFIAEEKKLVGHVISIIPSGDGMQRKYLVQTIS